MYDIWHIIDKTYSDYPADGQEIYCCIADGNTLSAVKKAIADVTYLKDLLYLHPAWKIFWLPMPPLPEPPSISAVVFGRKEVPHG